MSFIASEPATSGGIATASSALAPVIAGAAPDLVNAFAGAGAGVTPQQPAASGAPQPVPQLGSAPTPIPDTSQSVTPVIGGPHG